MNERSCRLDDIEKWFGVILPTPSGAKPLPQGISLTPNAQRPPEGGLCLV